MFKTTATIIVQANGEEGNDIIGNHETLLGLFIKLGILINNYKYRSLKVLKSYL
jgi:hypothetical protein